MKAQSQSNIGKAGIGFTLEVMTKELSEKEIQALSNLGLRYISQRISAVDIAIGIASKEGKKTVRTGKRGDAEFSEEKASLLQKCIQDALKEDEDLPLETTVVITASVGEAKEARFAYERALLAEKIAGGKKIADIAAGIGFAGEVFDEEENENGAYDYAPAFLAAVKAKIDAAKKSVI